VHSFGFNSRLDDLHAAFLSVKLKHITNWTDQRRAWAKRYTDGLKGNSFKLPRNCRATVMSSISTSSNITSATI